MPAEDGRKRKSKLVKRALHRGGGPSPGYRWGVLVFREAYAESKQICSKIQRDHLRDVVKILASEKDPTHSVMVDVEKVEDFYEIRDKGGTLGQLNIRLFFHLDKKNKEIVIVRTIHKQNNGPTPKADKILIAYRIRKYLAQTT